MYSLLILITFLVLKVVNTRLHRSLGSDPVPEEEEQEEEESKEQPNEESSIVLEVGKGREDRKSEDSTGMCVFISMYIYVCMHISMCMCILYEVTVNLRTKNNYALE